MSPARKIRPKAVSSTGKFPSIKMDMPIEFESLLELDFFFHLEFEKWVSAFGCQPLTIEYEEDGKYRHYTPDAVAVWKGNRRVLYECKPEKFVYRDENQRKYRAANRWCAENGYEFQVVTEKDIREGFLLRNIKYLFGFSAFYIPPIIKAKVYCALLEANEPISLADLVLRIADFPKSVVVPSIFQMAFFHEVDLPVKQEPISMNSIITISKE